MGLFEDLEYPDNNNRANRAAQLYQDIDTMLYTLHNDKAIIDAKLDNANKTIAAAFSDALPDSVRPHKVDLAENEVAKWTTYAADLLIPIVTAKTVTVALTNTFRTVLVNQGRLAEAAFVDLVGLPNWFKWGSRAGGAVGAALAFVVIDSIISSITGAVQRSALRDAISELIKPRVEIQQNVMITQQVKEALVAAITAFKAVKDANLDDETLETIARNIANEHLNEVTKITESAARDALADLDRARGAWTEEDNLST